MENEETGNLPAENDAVIDNLLEREASAEQTTQVNAAEATPEPVKAEPEAPKAQEERPDPRVPLSELIAERRNRQALERKLEQMVEALNRAAPPPPPPQQPEIWDDPSAFVRSQVEPVIGSQSQVLQALARENAEIRFGEDKVKQAEAKFLEFLNAGQLSEQDYSEVVNAPNRFAAAVKWLDRRTLLSEVGTDPNAYKQRLRQELMQDPEFRKELLASMQGEAKATQTRPVVSLPSLSKVGSAALPASNAAADDASLLAEVMAKRR